MPKRTHHCPCWTYRPPIRPLCIPTAVLINAAAQGGGPLRRAGMNQIPMETKLMSILTATLAAAHGFSAPGIGGHND
jgi:hypothetical protein